MAYNISKRGGGGVAGQGPVAGDGEMSDTAEAGVMQRQATDLLRGVADGRLAAGLADYGAGTDTFAKNAKTKPYVPGFDQLLNSKRTGPVR